MHLGKSAGYQTKVEQTLMTKSEIQEKHEYDILNKVVLKHHNKLLKQKKDEKLQRDERRFQIQKNMENDLMLKQKLKAINDERLEKELALKQKFDKMDNSKKFIDNSKIEFMTAKKEENMFKFMDQGENLNKVKRGHSAYKRQLAERILEKGQRGRDVSMRRYRVSELAIQNSQ